jgi:hypothetical protein
MAYDYYAKFSSRSWFAGPKKRHRHSLRVLLLLTTLLAALSIGAHPVYAHNPSKIAEGHSKVHVYLIRGLLNIFSLGMDDMAAKLQRQGIAASVSNHLLWPQVAAEAAEDYKSGKVRTIILIGHSAGADAVANIAARLGEQGVPVKLAISLDPGLSRMPASGHVDRYINYYVSTGIGHTLAKSPEFRGNFQNVDVAKVPGVGHFNIDKNEAMEERVLRDIHAAL